MKLRTLLAAALAPAALLTATVAPASAAPYHAVGSGTVIRAAFVEWGCTVTTVGKLPNGKNAALTAGHCFGDKPKAGSDVYGDWLDTKPIGKLLYSQSFQDAKTKAIQPDFAVVELRDSVPVKPSRHSVALAKVGDKVNSLGRIDKFTPGTVTKVTPALTYVKITAIPGNSGSPLFDSTGHIVGILSRSDITSKPVTPPGSPVKWGSVSIYESIPGVMNLAKAKTGFVHTVAK